MELNIFLHPIGNNPDPVWVSVAELEKLWSINSQYYIAEWTGEPRQNWFKPNTQKSCLLLGEIEIHGSPGSYNVMFLHGRHRTRWLIKQGYDEVPVGLPASQILLGEQLGLVTRKVVRGDHLSIT